MINKFGAGEIKRDVVNNLSISSFMTLADETWSHYCTHFPLFFIHKRGLLAALGDGSVFGEDFENLWRKYILFSKVRKAMYMQSSLTCLSVLKSSVSQEHKAFSIPLRSLRRGDDSGPWCSDNGDMDVTADTSCRDSNNCGGLRAPCSHAQRVPNNAHWETQRLV